VQMSALDGDTWSIQDRARLKGPWRLLRGSQSSSGHCGEHRNAVTLPTFKTNPDSPTSGPLTSHRIKFYWLCFQLAFHRLFIIHNKNILPGIGNKGKYMTAMNINLSHKPRFTKYNVPMTERL